MHHHDHVLDRPNKYAVLVILVLAIAGITYAFSGPAGKDVMGGVVKNVLSEKETTLEVGNKKRTIKEQELLVGIMTSEKKEIKVLNDFMPVEVGEKIYVRGSLFGESEFSVVDVSRTKIIILLVVFFVALVLLVGGWKGFYSLVGLLFSFAVIFAFMVPQILSGVGPVKIGLIGAAIILAPTLYLSYGLNKKSIATFLGIIVSLLFVGTLANYVVEAIRFSGLSEASVYLDMEARDSLNFMGLVIAGIIIAAVGVLDDVAAIQSSVVFSLASANSELRGLKLFKEAMKVGKDHISAVVNTLVLAYTGASLPLILLLSIRGMPAGYFVSIELVAEEIVRTLVSSSGLLLAVPLTTLIAVMMVNNGVEVGK